MALEPATMAQVAGLSCPLKSFFSLSFKPKNAVPEGECTFFEDCLSLSLSHSVTAVKCAISVSSKGHMKCAKHVFKVCSAARFVFFVKLHRPKGEYVALTSSLLQCQIQSVRQQIRPHV